MELIGSQKIWSYFEDQDSSAQASNQAIRAGKGHLVETYFELAKKVAELQFRNREHVLVFRGQAKDYLTTTSKVRRSLIKARIFRLEGRRIPSETVLEGRFKTLRRAEGELLTEYVSANLVGSDQLKRQRILRWAILQHYEVCGTPLLDVTHSLRIATSFATHNNDSTQAFLFILGVPNLSGAVTASSEAGLQIIRLSSACPPDAIRPHIQEGFLLGEYPEVSDFGVDSAYRYSEMDFGRRLVAKFRFNPKTFWKNENYPPASDKALYPAGHRDPLLEIAKSIRSKLNSTKQ
ncbi:FRG domain-containing protein [Rhizobium phaseoli]|uniref:FRG domain-containing protein n=1 Tax=Rhizobium phaseoli TaxID=396 RepID=UPI0014383BA1|nr:FRG domain-containing protein [Rhizobium phaseoli]MDK4729201.1 FRG domain-containing protein [Rhizobium phaseoli]NKE88897.1 FRG domain-containing protein [Rhizobium phaseoli]